MAMKASLIHLTIAFAATTCAFGYVQSNRNLSQRRRVFASSLTPLAMATGDGKQGLSPTKAIKKAIETTKKYGATSYKARLAWEVVEKMEYEYKNRSTEMEKRSDDLDEKLETRIDITNDATYDAVESNVRDLKSLIDEEMAKVKDLRNIANSIKEVKQRPRSISENKSIDAITAAQESTRAHGIHSAQTALAWKDFEELVSGDLVGLTP